MIQARNLSKIYKTPGSEVTVFDNLTLEIRKGGLVAVIGPSGAGKSTLLHLLGGLDMPTRGEVLFKNQNIFTGGHRNWPDFGTSTSVLSFSSITFCLNLRLLKIQ